MGALTIPKTRQTGASLASALVAGVMLSGFVQVRDLPSVRLLLLGLVVIAPLGAAVSIWSRRLPAQLLARGTWWSYLLASSLLTCVDDPALRHLAGLTAGATALALLAAGREGLEVGTGKFQPVAFRGTLTVALVLAMADTGALLWLGLVTLLRYDYRLILMVPLMVTGIVGLLRLRTWGLLAGMAANVLVATLAATRVLGLPDPLRGLFIGTALLQLLVPLPMLVAIVRRRPPPTDRWPRGKGAIVTATIVAIAGFGVYAGLVRQSALVTF
jgi:hypothetical protein